MQDEDPNVLSPLEVLSADTNPHLKRKREIRDDPADLPPAKRSSMIISVSYSSFPPSYRNS